MSNSTGRKPRRKQPTKPGKDFPLGIHKHSGYWTRKVHGRNLYFGKVADDPKGVKALQKWLDEKDDLLAGREPRPKTDELVVGELCNQFLVEKEASRDNRELSPRTFLTYYGMCEEVVSAFGRNRLVSDLTPDDFRKLRAQLAKTRGLVALKNAIQRVRTLFKFAFDEGIILAPPRFGQGFKKPTKASIDTEREKQRAKHGPQMFEAAEIRLMLEALDGSEVIIGTDDETGEPVKETLKQNHGLRAMVLLAANCGFGQSDLANLPTRAVNLDTGWVDYGRGKTGVPRKIPLWPETIAAVREWLPLRPKAKAPGDAHFLFLTCRGAKFLRLNEKGYHIDGIGQEFGKLIERLRLNRPRLGVYSLRHGFETVAGETGDQVAVDKVMGHKDGSMAAHYRERISDDRLRRVVEHVRQWLSMPTDTGTGDGSDSESCVPSVLADGDHDVSHAPRMQRTQSPHAGDILPSERPRLRIVG